MQLAIVFWFYKALDICADRIALLRRQNPGVPLYGLYGGPLDQADAARAMLGDSLDDLYVFGEVRDPHWKWLNGDQVIAAWMRERGGDLAWDTVVLVQWDMLLAQPIARMFGRLEDGEALFSGFRSLADVAQWWGWAGEGDPERRASLDEFRTVLERDLGYAGPLWCCLFIVVCLPRAFLARYAAAGPPEVGFLEYKMPTLARAWGVPVRTDPTLEPWWAADPATRDAAPGARALNAVGQEVAASTILAELCDPEGRRVFHPFSGPLSPELEGALAGRPA